MSNIVVGWVKQAFIEIINDPEVTKWVDKRIQTALTSGEGWLSTKLDEGLDRVLNRVEQLPGEIIGEGFDNVVHVVSEITGSTDDIANRVKTEVQPLFGGFEEILKNFQIPGLPNIFPWGNK